VLIVVWAMIALFVLSDLSENARGDSYLTRAIPWDFLAGAILSLLILAIDRLIRWHRSYAEPS
jgi:hypothetical protein